MTPEKSITPRFEPALMAHLDHRIENRLDALAASARLSSLRRVLTIGELAEDIADRLCGIANAHDALGDASRRHGQAVRR